MNIFRFFSVAAIVACSVILPPLANAAGSDTIPIPYARIDQTSYYAPFGTFKDLFGAESAKHPGLPWNLHFARDIVADKGGHVSAEIMFGEIYVSPDAETNGFLPSFAELPLEGGQAAQVTLVLNRTGAIAGKVRDDSGNPLAGAVVDVRGIPVYDKYGNVERCEIYASDISGHDGTYVVTSGIDPDCEYRLESGMPAYPYYSNWYLDPVSQRLVSDADHITPLRFKEPGHYGSLEQSSLFGSAAVDRLQVKQDEVTMANIVLEALAATNLGSVSGRVVDAGGRPMPYATVAAQADVGSRQGMTDRDGHFLIKHVPAGNYTIEASPSGSRFVVRHAEGILVRPGQNADIGVLAGDVSASISGTVTLSDGAPLAGAFVQIKATRLAAGYEHYYPCEDCIGFYVSDELDQRGTDEQGRYLLARNLPPGTYSISINNHDLDLGDRKIRLEPASRTIDVRSGENATNVDLVFNYTVLQDFAEQDAIRFHGHIMDYWGNPVGGVTVAARAFVQGHGSIEFTDETDDDGFYSMYVLQKDVPENADGLEWTIYVSQKYHSSSLFINYEDAVQDLGFAIYGGLEESGIMAHWGDRKQRDYTLQSFTLDDILTSSIKVDVRGEPARYSLPAKQFILSTGYGDGEDVYLSTNSTLMGSWLDTRDNSIVIVVNPVAGTTETMDVVIPTKLASKVSRVFFDGREDAGESSIQANATHTKISLAYKDSRRIEIQAAQVVPELGSVAMVAAAAVGGLVAARRLGYARKG